MAIPRSVTISLPMEQRAFQLYLEGKSIAEAAEIVSQEFNKQISTSSLQRISTENDWPAKRQEVSLAATEHLKKKAIKSIEKVTEEHLDAYRKMLGKGLEWFEDGEKEIRRAEDAIKAVDTAIRGERVVLSGIFNTEFVHAVLNIIMEEIQDEDTLKRVAAKLRQLASGTTAKEAQI